MPIGCDRRRCYESLRARSSENAIYEGTLHLFRHFLPWLNQSMYRLRKQLAEFLKKKRGDQTFEQFSRKIGLSASTLQRIEVAQQNVTLDTVQHIMDRFRCKISDIFAD